MTRAKRAGPRGNLVRCYLADEEFNKIVSFSSAMGITVSELIRRKLIYGGMLDVNPVELLGVFTQIGADLGTIRKEVKNIREALNLPANDLQGDLIERFRINVQEFDAVQECLTKAISMMLAKMDQKEKIR